MGTITIPVPDNCETETVTVVYKFKAAIPGLTKDEMHFVSSRPLPLKIKEPVDGKWSCAYCQEPFPKIRSCRMHERFCPSNPNHEENKGLTAAHKAIRDNHGKSKKTTPCQYCGKECGNQGLHRHEAACPKNPANVHDGQDNSSGKAQTAEKKPRNPMVLNDGSHMDHTLDQALHITSDGTGGVLQAPGPYADNSEIPRHMIVVEPVPKKNILQAIFGGKKVDLPSDFNPQQELKAGAYVWHDSWKVGKIRHMGNPDANEAEKRLPLVDFGNQELHFTPEGLAKMYKDMMRKAS